MSEKRKLMAFAARRGVRGVQTAVGSSMLGEKIRGEATTAAAGVEQGAIDPWPVILRTDMQCRPVKKRLTR